MTRRTFTIAIFTISMAALSARAVAVLAHEDFRVIGTVTRYEKLIVSVKKKDGNTAAIKIDRQTKFVRDGKKVEAAELKVGQTVVIDAYGDSENDALAIEIRIVPPIEASK